MPWVTEEEIQAAKNMTAYEYLRTHQALLIISEYVETELSPPPKENKRTKKKHQPER